MQEMDFKSIIRCDKGSPVPLYYQISQQLSELISRERLERDVKLPTEHELAFMLGISRLTARQAYNHLEDAGYVYKIKSRGTFVCDMKKQKNGNQIALLLFQVTPSTVKIINGIECALRDSGFDLSVRYSNANLDGEKQILNELSSPDIHGIIACPVVIEGRSNADAYRALSDSGKKIVLIERTLDGLNLPYVGFGNFQNGFLGASHLLENGNSDRFLFLSSASGASSIKEKFKGVEKAFADAGLSADMINSFIVPYHITGFDGAVEMIEKCLKSQSFPMAIFSVMSPLSLATCKAARNLGLKIPRDIRLLSADDDDESFSLLDPPMTAFKIPLYEMGRDAASAILKYINTGKFPSKETIIPVELIARESCGERKSLCVAG